MLKAELPRIKDDVTKEELNEMVNDLMAESTSVDLRKNPPLQETAINTEKRAVLAS